MLLNILKQRVIEVMCRLFGLYANKLVNVGFSFYESPKKSFVKLSCDNPSGWGVAWLDDEGWRICKEPIALYESRKAKELIRNVVRGKIIISHVRYATTGEPEEGEHSSMAL